MQALQANFGHLESLLTFAIGFLISRVTDRHVWSWMLASFCFSTSSMHIISYYINHYHRPDYICPSDYWPPLTMGEHVLQFPVWVLQTRFITISSIEKLLVRLKLYFAYKFLKLRAVRPGSNPRHVT